MGIPIILYGKSGSGKSSSLENFNDNEVTILAVRNKALPFKKEFHNRRYTPTVGEVITKMKKAPTKVIVIDDAGYLMTNYFMANHRVKTGNSQFDMYNDIADGFFTLINEIDALPDDKTVYVIMHEVTSDFGDTKLRTIGKLLDEKVCIEGLVTICIRCVNENGQHKFIVHGDGSDITKTPKNMFDVDSLENDLMAVDCVIREFYGLPYCNGQPSGTEEKTNV